jgi:hypothetical protein
MTYYTNCGNSNALLTKRQAERIHAKRRAKERFNMELTPEMRDKIIGKIRQGKAILVERQSLRTSKYMLVVSDQLVLVIYDKNRHEIVTLLEPNKQQVKLAQERDKLYPGI